MARLDPQSLPQHVDRLYRAAWALCGSPHDAEDLVQETFARVLARPRHLHGQDELAYLMRVLRNTFLTQRRTASRRPQKASVTLDDIDAPDPRTGERPEQVLQAREVFAAIAALPDNYRLAVVAVDIVGLSYREAAKALGTREATIATRVFRGRERVAKDMAGDTASESADRAGDTASESSNRAGDIAGEPVAQASEPIGQPADQAEPREASKPQGSLVEWDPAPPLRPQP
jgi:RNA polymerase sigma-70 factor (ECF subfamily)